MPLVVTVKLPAQLSLAVAPGSVKLLAHSMFVVDGPPKVTIGGVASPTMTVRVLVAELPLGSAAT